METTSLKAFFAVMLLSSLLQPRLTIRIERGGQSRDIIRRHVLRGREIVQDLEEAPLAECAPLAARGAGRWMWTGRARVFAGETLPRAEGGRGTPGGFARRHFGVVAGRGGLALAAGCEPRPVRIGARRASRRHRARDRTEVAARAIYAARLCRQRLERAGVARLAGSALLGGEGGGRARRGGA